MDHADVAIVTLAVDGEWPAGLRAHSGYLVPKPDQRLVTAVSFGSQKWAHWRGEGEVLRVSIGRDGRRLGDRDDDAARRPRRSTRSAVTSGSTCSRPPCA